MLKKLKSVWLLLIVLAISKFLLTAHLPIITINGPHDHLRFVRMAFEIFDFVPPFNYNQYVLIRQPGYPFFLYLNWGLGFPLKFSQELLYILSGFFFAWSIYKYYRQKTVVILFLALYIFAPGSFSWFRLTLQESLYLPQTVFIVSCLIHLVHIAPNSKKFLQWSLALGIGISWFWNTRPEAIWILPALIFTYVLILVRMLGSESTLRLNLTRVGRSLAYIVIPVILVTSSISFTTFLKYGIFNTNDLSTPGIKAAYSRLQSVSPSNARARVSVPRKTRFEVYSVSPTFKQISLFLEGKQRGWFIFGCIRHNICDDYGGGTFIWALRDAVAEAGQYKSAPATEAFYHNIAREIEIACNSGVLKCQKNNLSFVSSFAPSINFDYIKSFLKSLRKLTYELADEITSLDTSSGQEDKWLIEEYAKLNREPTDLLLQHNKQINGIKNNVIQGITKVYQVVFTLLLGLGIFGIFLQHVFSFKQKSKVKEVPLDVLWLILLCIVARVVLMAYVDATSFPGGGRYLWCVLPFVLMSMSIGTSYTLTKLRLFRSLRLLS